MTDDLRAELRDWIASRPHTARCPCAVCHPESTRGGAVRPFEERTLDVCGGCGLRDFDEARRCRACGMVKAIPTEEARTECEG